MDTSGFAQKDDPTKPRAEATVPFRDIIPDVGHPRIRGIESSDALSWRDSRREIAAAAWLISRLEAKNIEPLIGFTTDGEVKKGVYEFAKNEGAPVDAMKQAANDLLDILSPTQRVAVQFESIEADDFRLWSNPEIYVNPGGIRLDECSEAVQAAVHKLLRSSTSEHGYRKIRGCCLVNDFLGSLVNGKKVLNEHSYNFRLFGVPSTEKPWGYTFFGHHLCLAVAIYGKRMVIGPTFMGAEPDLIDEGPHAGLRLFAEEELVALKLMQSLAPELQERATLSKGMLGTDLPDGRWNPFDERHLGGARQDNRVVPYEGCPVNLFSSPQLSLLVSLFKAFNDFYPPPVLEHRLRNFVGHLDETYFAWIGGHEDDDVFYYRIHSPVAFMELDFHCGIFLTNTTPARCHIHTCNRLPNRGDYGRALIEEL